LNRRAGDEEVDYSFVNATALIAAAAASAPCGDVVGEISDFLGQPVSGTQISVLNSSGSTVGSTVTGSNGAYAFRGLHPGAYTINSNGKSVVTYVGKDGMKVNWGVRPGAEPVVRTAGRDWRARALFSHDQYH
jgi:hypothetical protein